MMKKYAFGVDIGGTTTKLGFFEADGKLIDKWEIKTRTESEGKFILADIAKEIKNKIENVNISFTNLEGIGLGVPGPVSHDGIVLKCVNLGWDIVDVKRKFTKLTGLEVKVGNDANVAALGEIWQGAGQGYKNIVMITLGTGVGGGIILNGRILSGVHGASGEIGHMTMNDSEIEICGCGNKGCLEQYASATGVVQMTKNFLDKEIETQSNLREYTNITAKDIFDEAKKGDIISLKMVEKVGRLIGKSLAMISCIIDPDLIIVGGGMAEAGDILFDSIGKYYYTFAFHTSRHIPIKAAVLGNNAGIYGGAKLLLEKYNENNGGLEG